MYESIKFIHGGKFVSRGIWKHPERIIESTELIIVTKGTVHITEGEREYCLKSGDILRLDKGIRHFGHRESHEQVKFYWFHFHCSNKNALPPKCFSPQSSAEAELICRQILHYEKTDGYGDDITDCLIRALIIELKTSEMIEGSTPKKLCTEIAEWIRGNCDLAIKVSDVADHFGYNEDYLCRAFKNFHPDGLKTYIDEARMKKIRKDLGDSEKTLKEIAAKYNFSEYKYFLKYFKYHEGISPTDYRKTYCNLHINNS